MQRFSDVLADHPQADAIAWAAGVGLTVGYGDGTFRPDDPLPRWAALIFMERFYDVLQASESDGLTRGDMMGLLHTIHRGGVPAAKVAQSVQRFSDVLADHPQADAIAWAAGVGLTVGYGDGTFRPDDPLPRWAALIFMERFYDVLQASESDGFTRGDMMQLLHTIAAPPVAATSGDAAACAGLRRGRYYTYAGSAPERVEVTAVTVAFDDLAAPDESYTAGLGQQPEQTFITELLAALEAKLEALSHGRTDWVFHRGSDITLSGTAQSRSQPASLGRRTLAGMAGELRAMYPGKHLLAFTASDYDSPSFNPYTSFYSAGVASVAVTAIDEEDVADFFEPDLAHYQLSYSRFGQALFDAAHEVLHLVGLDDTYQIRTNDGRGHSDRDSGQDSIMGLSSYGWGLGQIRSGGLLWARPWASHPGRGFFNGVMNLDEPSGNYPHGPMTGWNKWILGWLNDTEATCVFQDTATTVTVRPHQQTTISETERWSETHYRWLQPKEVGGDCWRLGRPDSNELDQWVLDVLTKPSGGRETRVLPPHGWWGPATSDPAIAIIPTSDTAAVVIEADPFAAAGPAGLPQCFIGELPGSRTTRFVGDIIVYDVDLTAPDRPLLMVNPTAAVVTPQRLAAETRRFSATGSIGQSFGGLAVDSYFVSEVTVHGYRIAVQGSTTTVGGQHEVTVSIEPVS
ncbi:MAG: S-layer homology domain-containing protein [Acidimicrobiaceae bacterium]|nr:S-layer homology domain-containing protein [Acidimicrobiaceae bacterium]